MKPILWVVEIAVMDGGRHLWIPYSLETGIANTEERADEMIAVLMADGEPFRFRLARYERVEA